MSNSHDKNLSEIFKAAADIAKEVPENMQEAAFNRALDMLTSNQATLREAKGKTDPARKRTISKTEKSSTDETGENLVGTLLKAINSTEHPDIANAQKVLDRALLLLRIAKDEHDIDGLAPSEIATLLTEKFRLSTTNQAVGMALGRATKIVDRIPDGGGYRYRIMSPGEKYLDGKNFQESEANEPSKKRSKLKKSKSSKPRQAKKKKAPESNNSKSSRPKIKNTKSGLAPKAAILGLINDGFFSVAKSGPEVQTELKHRRGHTIGINQIRLTMLRLVRDEILARDQNSEGQYEYRNS